MRNCKLYELYRKIGTKAYVKFCEPFIKDDILDEKLMCLIIRLKFRNKL